MIRSRIRSTTSNRISCVPLVLVLVLGGLSLGCSDEEPNLTWYKYFTYLTPCPGYTRFDDYAVCSSSQTEGAACDRDGAICAVADSICNVRLMCTDVDARSPIGDPEPISRAAYKRDIHYVTADERAALAQQALAIPLATYRYKTQTDARTHLGFIIEDVEPSPAVRSEANHVDLYGYSSMMLAALQTQQAELAAMRAEIAAVREELAALRRRKQ